MKVSKLLPLFAVYVLACGSATAEPKEPVVVYQPPCETLPGSTCFKYHEAPGRQTSEPIIPTSLQTKNRNPVKYEKVRE